MFDSKVIKVDTFVSQKSGKPFKVVWFTNEKGLPCKAFAPNDFLGIEGDKIHVSIEPSFDCTARVEIRKA